MAQPLLIFDAKAAPQAVGDLADFATGGFPVHDMGYRKAASLNEPRIMWARVDRLRSMMAASVYEHPEILDLELLRVYFGPFADSADRRELVKGFAAAERNRD
ncbi:MAG TPA: hypothetical protein VKB29_02795 [Candidatus Binataceae bacterium]|nr:hypothetical protein [Candidatus Binataceae bacterium]